MGKYCEKKIIGESLIGAQPRESIIGRSSLKQLELGCAFWRFVSESNAETQKTYC